MPGREHDSDRDLSAPLTPDEFATLFQGSSRLLWTIAAGVLGSPMEAEDVLQEAAMRALGKLEQFQRGTSFQAWMGSFVRNVGLNHLRKRSRRGKSVRMEVLAEHLDELPHSSPGPSEPPIGTDGRLHEDQANFDDVLLAELKEIAAVPRACLLLRSLLELSYREISEALDIPEGTAMSHVHRTRNLLRQRLGGHRTNPTNGRVIIDTETR